jgi:hypothetical protein
MQSLVVATSSASGITYQPLCDAHRAAATFTIDFDDLDSDGRRELYCDHCIADGLRYSITRSWFTPPTVSRIAPTIPLEWRCARCGGDPKTCPVVAGRCARAA